MYESDDKTVIPIVDKDEPVVPDEDPGPLENSTSDETDTSVAEQTAPDDKEPADIPDESESQQTDTQDALTAEPASDEEENEEISNVVGFVTSSISESLMLEDGESVIDIEYGIPKVSYSDGSPLPNINSFYDDFLSEYLLSTSYKLLKLMENSSDSEEEAQPKAQLSFAVTYNENWLLSVMSEESANVPGVEN